MALNDPLSQTGAPNTKPFTPEQCFDRLEGWIKEERPRLEKVYEGERLKTCAKRAARMIEELQKKGCTLEYAKELSTLVLYDVVMLLDDSSSMRDEEGGMRIETLKNTMCAIVDVYDLANDNGISSVKFLNKEKGKKNITRRNVKNVLDKHYFHGVTKIGHMLDKRILNRFVYGIEMEKPLLIMIITDGEIEGEEPDVLRSVINTCVQKCGENQKLGKDAVAFHFSRVGDDEGAKTLLEELDHDGGEHVDCLPVDKKLENIQGVEKWNVLRKLLLGALMNDVNDDDKPHEVNGEAGDLVRRGQSESDDSDEEVDEEVEEAVEGKEKGNNDEGKGEAKNQAEANDPEKTKAQDKSEPLETKASEKSEPLMEVKPSEETTDPDEAKASEKTTGT